MRCRTISSGRWPVVLICGVLLAWLSLLSASAHAAYESSTPGFAEVLDDSPAEISIRFSQELFRREGANSITLTRTHSDVEFALGTLEIGNDDRRVMRIKVVAELVPGRYLVSWTNLSAEDGDADSGSYSFYVGRAPTEEEVNLDSALAAQLLIAYPEDEEGEPVTEPAPTAAAPAVVRNESNGDVSLDPGPIVWMAAGLIAAIALAGALGFHLGRRSPSR